jgi:DNA-binding CsgD family transcriptional regulator
VIEPSADMRMLAHTLREMFVALVAEGFSDNEAMQIIGITIAANIGGQSS